MSRTNCTPDNVQDVPAGVVSTGPGQRRQSVFDVVRSVPGYGRRRRRQDKHDKVVAVLINESLSKDKYGHSLSDNEIARLCGVHHATVGRIRKKLFPAQKKATNRVVKRGNSIYVQDTTNIGVANKQRRHQTRQSPDKTYLKCPEDPALAVQALVDLMGQDYVQRLCQSLQDYFSQKGISAMVSNNSTSTKPHVVLMQITPTMAANPEARQDFQHPDIRAYVHNRRRLVLQCLLGLVENWLAAGRPKGRNRLGGFENWSEAIGGILQVNGISGWRKNEAGWRQRADVKGEEMTAFVNAWHEKFKDETEPQTPKELQELAKEKELFSDIFARKSEHGINVAFGRMLQRYIDTPVDKWFVRYSNDAHRPFYHLEKIA